MACDQAFPIDPGAVYEAEMHLLAGKVQQEFARAARRVGTIRTPVPLSVIRDLLEREVIEAGPGMFGA